MSQDSPSKVNASKDDSGRNIILIFAAFLKHKISFLISSAAVFAHDKLLVNFFFWFFYFVFTLLEPILCANYPTVCDACT